MGFSFLLLRRISTSSNINSRKLSLFLRPFSFHSDPQSPYSDPPKPTSLSARMSFVFDQIEAIEKERAQKDETLQRIRSWRESKKAATAQDQSGNVVVVAAAAAAPDMVMSCESGSGTKPSEPDSAELQLEAKDETGGRGLLGKEVELVHPWPEWIGLMERLVQQNYFDIRRNDDEKMMEDLGFDVSEVAKEEGFDFTRDYKTVQTALLNLGKDRFDILRSLSRQDLQILVGYGCPSAERAVVFSAKLLRKYVHLDEGDVCSSCNLRNSCERAYLRTNKEDEARTIDVMRILLTYGFDAVNGSVVNKPLTRMKSVKNAVRNLLREVVKLSAVPIDPNLPPPIIRKPPPKVKKPPPPPKKRVGRDDIEMKKGDWLCPKCDFMNFAKNTVCLQCEAKRPKRQLLPGEWECPQCNFLNYRRNMVCFNCEHKRPVDEFMENQLRDRNHSPRVKLEKISGRPEVSNAWNFDFDDNESDGADVAAFEYADSRKMDYGFMSDKQGHTEASGGHENGFTRNSQSPRSFEVGRPGETKSGMGFNDFEDFDDEEDGVDSYELDTHNETQRASRVHLSELEDESESDDIDDSNRRSYPQRRRSSVAFNKPSGLTRKRTALPGSEDAGFDFDSDDDLPVHPEWQSSHVGKFDRRNQSKGSLEYGSDDDDLGLDSEDDLPSRQRNRRSTQATQRKSGRKGISDSEDESFSDMETNDRMHFRRHEQRGKGANQNRKRDLQRNRRNGRMSFIDAETRSRDRQESKGIRSNGYDSGKMSDRGNQLKNFRRPRQDSANREGRYNRFSDQSSSYLDDERYRRPRVNVR